MYIILLNYQEKFDKLSRNMQLTEQWTLMRKVSSVNERNAVFACSTSIIHTLYFKDIPFKISTQFFHKF